MYSQLRWLPQKRGDFARYVMLCRKKKQSFKSFVMQFDIARKIELERKQDEIRFLQEEKLKQERIKFLKNLDKNCTIPSDPSEVNHSSIANDEQVLHYCTSRERVASFCTSEESDEFLPCMSTSNSFASLDSLQ